MRHSSVLGVATAHSKKCLGIPTWYCWTALVSEQSPPLLVLGGGRSDQVGEINILFMGESSHSNASGPSPTSRPSSSKAPANPKTPSNHHGKSSNKMQNLMDIATTNKGLDCELLFLCVSNYNKAFVLNIYLGFQNYLKQ